MSRRLRIAAVEPYFGGSHRHFLTDLQRHSRHEIQLFTLPPRLWKWRVRGAALALSRAVNEAGVRFDVLLCSDFGNLPDLRALLRPELRAVPVLYYMHENQLSYPLSPDEEFDPYFGFTNVLSCLSAEAVVFNSDFQRRDFMAHLPDILPRLPDYEPRWVIDTIAAKAEVLPVGIDVGELEALRPERDAAHEPVREAGHEPQRQAAHAPERQAAPGPLRKAATGRPRRVLWNHRWEFDKRPERFFSALDRLIEMGVPFVADIVGESFARRPPVFDTARERLGDRLGHFGYVDSREDYIRLLWQSDLVVSTANQEFFGISMCEAALCGAHPIAPDGLVYRDLYAGPCARRHLYRDEAELVQLMRHGLAGELDHGCALPARLRDFDWRSAAPRFDSRLDSLAGP